MEKSMSDPKTVVTEFVDALLSRGPEEALAYLDPELVLHEVTRLPYAGVYRGHAGFLTLVRRMNAFWEHIEGEQKLIEDGPFVVVVGWLRGRTRAAGERLEIPVLERYHVRDGRIVELWPFYVDTHLAGRFG